MRRTIGLVAGLALAAAAVQAAQAGERWDMPTAYADSNYHTQNARLFADAVGICTGGGLEIVVHGNGALVAGGEIKRAVETGEAAIGERFLSAHQDENPVFGFDSVPFLATSFAASERLWQAARGRLGEILAGRNLVLLYSVPWPPQGLYVKGDIQSVADLEGTRFRAYNETTARLAALAGMPAVHVEAAALRQALEDGTAEAFVSSSATGYDRQVWDYVSHFYDARAWMPRNTVFANADAFASLDGQAQNCLRAAALMAEAAGTARARALSGHYLAALAENGMSVQAPGARLAAELAAIGAVMAAEWAEAAGRGRRRDHRRLRGRVRTAPAGYPSSGARHAANEAAMPRSSVS